MSIFQRSQTVSSVGTYQSYVSESVLSAIHSSINSPDQDELVNKLPERFLHKDSRAQGISVHEFHEQHPGFQQRDLSDTIHALTEVYRKLPTYFFQNEDPNVTMVHKCLTGQSSYSRSQSIGRQLPYSPPQSVDIHSKRGVFSPLAHLHHEFESGDTEPLSVLDCTPDSDEDLPPFPHELQSPHKHHFSPEFFKAIPEETNLDDVDNTMMTVQEQTISNNTDEHKLGEETHPRYLKKRDSFRKLGRGSALTNDACPSCSRNQDYPLVSRSTQTDLTGGDFHCPSPNNKAHRTDGDGQENTETHQMLSKLSSQHT